MSKNGKRGAPQISQKDVDNFHGLNLMSAPVLVKPAVDIEEDVRNQPQRPQDLRAVTELAEELRQLDHDLQELSNKSQLMMDRYNLIQKQLLPEMMMTIGMSEFKLTAGDAIIIKPLIRASIPTQSAIDKADGEEKSMLAERRRRAFLWLRKNDADVLIKNELVAEFGKGQDQDAKAWFSRLVKKGYKVKCEESVNFQTLNAFIRERLEHGENVPSEPFALYNGKIAELNKPKRQ